MKVELKNLPNSEVEITISVPYDIYSKWQKKAYEELSSKVKVDGFRPGNIPEDVLKEKVKPEIVEATTIDYLLPSTYAEAVKQNDIQVVGQPRIDIKKRSEKEGDDFVYIAVAPVMPEVKVGNWKKISVKKEEAKIKPEQVEETIQMILDRNAQWSKVDRAAKDGDRVEINFEGFDKDGNALPNTKSENHPLILGSKMMVPGFEDALVGIKEGEEREFTVTFPKDYHAESMQGAEVSFKCKCNGVEEKEAKEMTPEFIEQLTGQKESVEDFKKRVEEDLKGEVQSRMDNQHYTDVVKAIIEITKVDLPQALIDQETGLIIQEEQQRTAQQGLTWEQALQHMGKTEEEFKKELEGPAQDRLKARLAVQHIIKEADIEVKDEEVQAKIDEMITAYPEEYKEKALEYYKPGGDAFRNMQYGMKSDKLIDMLTK